jgi:hypothetical protein
MTPEELGNSIPLNTSECRYKVDAPEVISAVWTVVYGTKKYRPESKQAEHVKLLLSKLYTCHMSKYDCIAYSRNRNDYTLGSDRNVCDLSCTMVVAIVDALVAAQYIGHYPGFFDNVSKKGMLSRMRAYESLITLIENVQIPIPLPYEDGISDDSRFIILKDADKNPIPFVDDDFTIAWNQQLIDYNRLLAGTSLSLSCPIPKGVNFDKRIVTRTFNDSSFRLGGRFYCGWWLRMKSEYRKYILINGEPTVEIDYKGIHLFLAYLMEGIDCRWFANDPYVVDAPDLGMEWRDVTKAVTLTALNASTRTKACQSINGKMNRKGKKKIRKHPRYSPSQLVDMCADKHSLINRYFNTDSGKLLQFYDSHIASQVIKHYTDLNIPILCIHDSFICQEKYSTDLNEIMKKIALVSFGMEPTTKWSSVSEAIFS